MFHNELINITPLGLTLLKIVLILLLARFGGWIFERIKQPAVLGELVVGMILGPSILGWVIHEQEPIIVFLAEIGAILLLFTIGLESNIYQLVKVGITSTLVAFIGVVTPMLLAYLYFISQGYTGGVAIFVGGVLTATSVGLTMRVLRDLGKLNTKEGKIVLGAAVIDDVLGLIVLSLVIGIIGSGGISIGNVAAITIIAAIFLVGSLYLGIKFMPFLYKIVHRMEIRRTFVISSFMFALFLGFIANSIKLATIVGAFAAGLILERTEHKEHFKQKMVPVADLFIPIFFVMAGVLMDFSAFMNAKNWIPIIVILVIAVIGKIAAGLGAFGTKARKLAIGIGMIPRGEVGLIFAAYGITNKIINAELYSILIAVVLLTTFITPPFLKRVFK